MAVLVNKLRIVHYPHPLLRQRAKALPAVTEEVRQVARRMLELMHEAPGVGLAAPQVALPWRLFVANPTGEPGDDQVFINPELADPSAEQEEVEEGCLSLPGIQAVIRRPKGITLRALDLEGRPLTLRSEEFPARIWQHEFDHLEGVLLLDRMGMMDKLANRKAIKALEVGREG